MRWLWLLVPIAYAQDDAEEPKAPIPTVSAAQGTAAFATIYSVLTSPRCSNCHPTDEVPLTGDHATPHPMQITRNSPAVGLPCTTCHRKTGLDLPHVPPSAAIWALPPRNQAFVGRTPAQLCQQLNQPESTGGRDLTALLHHVEHDALVLYGWNPGGGRTTPPVSHPTFVEAFALWANSGGACPE